MKILLIKLKKTVDKLKFFHDEVGTTIIYDRKESMKTVHKFFLLGILATLVDYIFYSIVILLGIDYILAIIIGYSAGLLTNYIIARNFIFTSGHRLKSSRHEFIAVLIIAVFGALFTIAIVKMLSYSILHMDPLLSRPIAIVIVFFWNYLARKIFVYNPVSL